MLLELDTCLALLLVLEATWECDTNVNWKLTPRSGSVTLCNLALQGSQILKIGVSDESWSSSSAELQPDPCHLFYMKPTPQPPGTPFLMLEAGRTFALVTSGYAWVFKCKPSGTILGCQEKKGVYSMWKCHLLCMWLKLQNQEKNYILRTVPSGCWCKAFQELTCIGLPLWSWMEHMIFPHLVLWNHWCLGFSHYEKHFLLLVHCFLILLQMLHLLKNIDLVKTVSNIKSHLSKPPVVTSTRNEVLTWYLYACYYSWKERHKKTCNYLMELDMRSSFRNLYLLV